MRRTMILMGLMLAALVGGCMTGLGGDADSGSNNPIPDANVATDMGPTDRGPIACIPECRDGFTCEAGACVSQCNPGCSVGEVCMPDANDVWACIAINPVDAGMPAVDTGTPVTDVPRICAVPCRGGFTCLDGTCVTNCNPPCNGGQECTQTTLNGWVCLAPPVDAGTPDVPVVVDAGGPACIPECRSPFTCVNGGCVSACNPACASNESCTVTNGTARCIANVVDAGTPDVPGVCAAGFADCNGSSSDGCEASIRNDINNCGACGTVCPARTNAFGVCAMGQCNLVCAAGFADCNGSSSDGCEASIENTLHCGSCGRVCNDRPNSVAACPAGTCTYACQSGFADCDGNAINGCEVNTNNNNASCGACGRTCPSGSVCANGSCESTCNPADGGVTLTPCSGSCRDIQTDRDNCGACGHICPTIAGGHPICVAGVCNNACNVGRADCDHLVINSCEAEITTDVSNCGACGNTCATVPNSAPVCRTGYCSYNCQPGFADCDGYVFNGCESRLNNDRNNCGACGNRCVASQTCNNGVCEGALCPPGQVLCFGLCADRATEIFNCGTCGRTCSTVANGSRTCQSGLCTVGSCNAGFMDCNGLYSDGCEAQLSNDANNCGVCGRACAAGQTCSSGMCINACPIMGQTSCNGVCLNTQTDINNCGACSNRCPTPNNTSGATCLSGACGFAGCSTGFGNCNGIVADGCETLLNTDMNNCGVCGRICPLGTICSAGVCGSTMTDGGFSDAGTDASVADSGLFPGEHMLFVQNGSGIVNPDAGVTVGSISNACRSSMVIMTWNILRSTLASAPGAALNVPVSPGRANVKFSCTPSTQINLCAEYAAGRRTGADLLGSDALVRVDGVIYPATSALIVRDIYGGGCALVVAITEPIGSIKPGSNLAFTPARRTPYPYTPQVVYWVNNFARLPSRNQREEYDPLAA